MLARKLKEREEIETEKIKDQEHLADDGTSVDNNAKIKDDIPLQLQSTLKIQKLRELPYKIPAGILNLPSKLNAVQHGLLRFEPFENECILCETKLTNSMYPQGVGSEGGNGVVICNNHF